ncbi:hypothetical protein [Candidatus Chlorohelix sp.]|uniref:OmpL47-type beta-barrel domain-containing protein n=1 Tax=Candidatus Chlorohelix sp. TaxID=3139201 RepID=UPI0030612792
MSQKVEIKLSSEQITLKPGGTAELTVTLINNTKGVERFELSIGELTAGWAQLDQLEMLLYPDAPGNEGSTILRINLPANAAPGTYAPVLLVGSSSQPGIIASQPLLLNVEEIKQITQELKLQPQELQTRKKTAVTQIGISNNQYQPVNLKLYARTNVQGMEILINPPIVTVPSQAEITASSLEIKLRKRNWVGSPRMYDFTIGIEGQTTETNGVINQACALPWLRSVALSPVLLALALLLPLAFVLMLLILMWPSGVQTSTSNQALPPAICTPSNITLNATLRMGETATDIIIVQSDGSRPRSVFQESVDILPGNFASLMSISPDGRKLAYITAKNAALDNATINILDLNSRSKTRAVSVANGLWTTRPTWSADSAQLGYIVRNTNKLELFKVAASGREREISLGIPDQLVPEYFYGDTGQEGPLCWSTDNSRIIVNSTNNAFTVNVTDKKVNALPKLGQTQNFAIVTDRFQQVPTKNLTPAPALGGDCFVINYSQNDPRWRNSQIGAQTFKIGDSGCAITAAAMLLNYSKADTDPDQLNSCLGLDAIPMDWSLTAVRCSKGVLSGAQRQDFNWDSLNSILKSGQPALVGFLGGQTGTQFVVVVSGSDSIAATYRINDPWDGTSYKSLAYYLEKGYQLRWLINYGASGQSGCQGRFDTTATQQTGITLTSPVDGKLYNQAVPLTYQVSGTTKVNATLNMLTTTSTDGNLLPSGGLETNSNVIPGAIVEQDGAYILVLDNGTNQISAHFIIDKTPPRLDLVRPKLSDFDPTGTQGNQLVARNKISLEFKASDNLSGVSLIEYKINQDDWKPYNNDSVAVPITIEKAGDYSILYRATDGAGNRTPEGNLTFALISTTGQVTSQSGTANQSPTAAGSNQQGGSNGAGEGANTTPQPTAMPGVLAVAPNALNFDAFTNQAFLQLSNSGQGTVAWNIQQPSGTLASLLKFNLQSGTIPPSGNTQLTVSLNAFNLTQAPINGVFNIVYNNGAAQMPINVVIIQQPTPTVQFISPIPGPLNGKTVDIKVTAIPTGLAAPNHMSFTAKYIASVGGSLAELPIPGQANASNSWGVTWDISTLPPQTPIEIGGKLCWTADESNCIKLVQPLAGLSIPKPAATITLNPNSDKLGGTVTLSAQVTGVYDHITYTYTYNDATGATVSKTLEKSNAANNNTVKWNTTAIPPQTGITLDAKVCWGTDDNVANCTTPTNQLPSAFTVEAPTLTVSPLSSTDQANVPVLVSLSGAASKISSVSTVVFVNYKYIPTVGGEQVEKNDTATLSAVSNGAATWSIQINTAAMPPQQITFTPKICWDGNATGIFCYPVQAAVQGTIPDLIAQFATPIPTDLSKSTILNVSGTPTARVKSIRYYATYQANDGTARPDVLLSGDANSANNFGIAFDSTALGIKPNQQIIIKLKACNSSGYCGPFNATPLNWNVPEAAINFTSPVTTTLSLNTTITGTVTGRGASAIILLATYLSDPTNPTTVITTSLTTINNKVVSDTISYVWSTATIPPQPGVKLTYRICWGQGELDSQDCHTKDITDYSSLTIPEPQVTNIIVNGTSPYNVVNVLPIAFDSTASPLASITIPLTATITGNNVGGVKWILSDLAGSITPTILLQNSQVNSTTPEATGNLLLNLQQLSATVDLLNDTLFITAVPVWGTVSSGVSYSGSTNIVQLKIKLVNMTVSMNNKGAAPVQLAPVSGSPTPANYLMLSSVTTFTVAIPANAALIKRVMFDATYKNSSGVSTTTALSTISGPKSILPTGSGPWTVTWDHTTDTPKIDPQNEITLHWRLCATASPDDSGCQSPGLAGNLSSINGLTLGGARFNLSSSNLTDNQPGTVPKATDYFNSSPQALIELSALDSVKLVRIVAYPTNNPSIANTIILGNHTDDTSTPSNAVISSGLLQWNLSAFWSLDESGITTKLINNATDRKVSLGIQYCTETTPATLDAVTCSDWDGKLFAQMSSNWKGSFDANMGAVVLWKPYDGTTNPYDSYIQTGALSTRNLTATVIPFSGVSINSSNGVSFNYTVQTNSGTSIGTAALMAISSGNDWNYSWNIGGISFLVDNSITRSVTLKASVTFTVTGDASQKTKDTVIKTHGRT